MQHIKGSPDSVFTIGEQNQNSKTKKIKEDNKLSQYIGDYVAATFEKKSLKNKVNDLKVHKQAIDQEKEELENEEAILLKQLEKIQKEKLKS